MGGGATGGLLKTIITMGDITGGTCSSRVPTSPN